jgi:membrane-bound lytic murein transglycosylase MltF
MTTETHRLLLSLKKTMSGHAYEYAMIAKSYHLSEEIRNRAQIVATFIATQAEMIREDAE